MKNKEKVIFVGRDNPFNRGVITWLDEDFEVIAAYFVESDRLTLKGRLHRLRKRATRYGFLKVANESLFHIFDRIYVRRNEKKYLDDVPDRFKNRQEIHCPGYKIKYINSKDCIEFTKSLRPDFVFSVCSSVIFKPDFYNIPRLGTLVLHEGLTPEYKGLHTPLWALVKNETEYLGYTLLKVNDEIDAGTIISQKQYVPQADEGVHCWGYVAHKAITSGLGDMKKDLIQYVRDNNEFEFVSQEGRESGYYTWMGLSEFIKYTTLKKYRKEFPKRYTVTKENSILPSIGDLHR